MSNRWVIIDGYSVMHAWPKLRKLAKGRSLELRREALVRVLRQYADHSGRRVTVVFDGYAAKHKPDVIHAGPGVDVLFSEHGKTADDAIERLVGQSTETAGILVVTSDSMERQTVESMGAHSISAEAFEVEVDSELRELTRAVREHSPGHGRRRLGRLHERFGR